MPAISRIRLTNVVYEEGNKRYNDELFLFDGHNGAILLENGGGKTVLIQTALQAIIPHTDLAERKIKNTLLLENAPAHIAIEWIDHDQPRRYVVTAVTLYMTKHGLESFRYVYEYEANDPNDIEGIPFVRDGKDGKRTADRGEMQDYYAQMRDRSFKARSFPTIKEYRNYIENQYHIVADEWDSIVKINSSEGGVEAFFDDCKTTNSLFDRLLIPTVENSISGHDQKLFADMFEKQHTSFKQYKKLKETIEENKRIQVELENFVQTFEKLHQSKLNYEKSKQKAKGTWEEIHQQKNKTMDEQTVILQKLETWYEKHRRHEVKSTSYEIAVEESLLQTLTKAYDQAFARYSELKESLEGYEKDYYSLRLAELKVEQKQFQEHLNHIEMEIEKRNDTEEIHDLEDQLEEGKRNLLGFFMTKAEEIQKDIQGLLIELNPIEDQLTEKENVINHLQKEETFKFQSLSKDETRVETRTKDMEKLVQQLLANPQQERVEEEIVKWNERYQFLDNDMIRLRQEEKTILAGEKEAQERKDSLQQEKADRDREYDQVVHLLDIMEKGQKTLIEKLSTVRPQWANLDSVYEYEKSIFSRLNEAINKLKNERKLYLYRERMAYRFTDDYGEQDLFFGDAFVESQLKSWKNQVDYLTTGIEYLQTLDEQEYEQKKQYPLWPLTLITTKKSKAHLQEKIRNVADRLQYPIDVITTEEVANLPNGELESWVAPLHWENGMGKESFQVWKEEITESAKKTTQLREKKEEEIKTWENVLQACNQFFENHSFNKVTQLHDERSTLINQRQQLTLSIKSEKEKIDEWNASLTRLKNKVAHYQDEKQGLEGKIEKGNQYLYFHKEVEEARKSIQVLKEELETLQREIKNAKHQYHALFNEKQERKDRQRSLEIELNNIKQDEDYKEVGSFIPLYTGEDKKTIQEKIRNLEYKIRQIHVSYGEWNERLKSAKNGIERTQRDINQLQMEHKKIDKDRHFPSDGKQVLTDLWGKIEQVKQQVDTSDQEVKQKLSEKHDQKGKWQSKVDRFTIDYPDGTVYTFSLPLEQVKSELADEKAKFKESKRYLEQEKTRIEQEFTKIEDAERWLERFIEKHHFNAPDIRTISLTEDEVLEFTYQRKKFVQSIVEELERANDIVKVEYGQVEREKQAFRQFCQTITDVKMRKMAENGIEHKRTYKDLIEFKKNMLTSVERATNYANEHIRQKDAELQAYINQIHAHLKTLVEELKQIPKKTKVKVEDDWKSIFNFTIPEWEEEDGKTRIRDYIEWILQQLESDRFINDQGLQDDGKVRKEIEMWLQSKQLLQMVMKNETMKVNCRKVTNDNKVTTRSFSWEHSNVWSGGEKWSKNMTLFLGILNYVAEKKQHIQPNMKRHRSVILDNPFGKASSDHVLSPVFFIAEQLGFQIIALTAHAEGKFLQDFFPVIYSCRLRESNDSNKKVMTKEKWLHHAYFQDHEPKSVERLGEMEQMALFD